MSALDNSNDCSDFDHYPDVYVAPAASIIKQTTDIRQDRLTTIGGNTSAPRGFERAQTHARNVLADSDKVLEALCDSDSNSNSGSPCRPQKQTPSAKPRWSDF